MLIGIQSVVKQLVHNNRTIHKKMEEDESYKQLVAEHTNGSGLVLPDKVITHLSVVDPMTWMVIRHVSAPDEKIFNMVHNPTKSDMILLMHIELNGVTPCIIDENLNTSITIGRPMTPRIFKEFKSYIPNLDEQFDMGFWSSSSFKLLTEETENKMISLKANTVLGEVYVAKKVLDKTNFNTAYTKFYDLLHTFNYKTFKSHTKQSTRILNIVDVLDFILPIDITKQEGNLLGKNYADNFICVD